MVALVAYLEQMTNLWALETNNATQKGDTCNIAYCKAKFETYHSILQDIKRGRFGRNEEKMKINHEKSIITMEITMEELRIITNALGRLDTNYALYKQFADFQSKMVSL